MTVVDDIITTKDTVVIKHYLRFYSLYRISKLLLDVEKNVLQVFELQKLVATVERTLDTVAIHFPTIGLEIIELKQSINTFLDLTKDIHSL